jgi:hypothetical protein
MKLIRLSIIALATTGFLFTSCKKESNPPTPIVVSAGPSQSVQLPVDSVTLTGRVISGQNPTLVYSWTFIVGPITPTILNGDSLTATVKGLIAGTYIFQFAATNSTGTVIGEDTVSVVVDTVNSKTLVLQPSNNQYEGWISDDNTTAWFGASLQILAASWTRYGAPDDIRACILFDFSSIPSGATIDNATLFLYSDPNPLNGNLVDAQYGTSNACYVKRITSSWVLPNPFTWNSQPNTVTANEAVIPQSDSSNENAVIDVAALVKDMQAYGNNGFFIQLQNEIIYQSRQYASSYVSNAALHPKLVITYH